MQTYEESDIFRRGTWDRHFFLAKDLSNKYPFMIPRIENMNDRIKSFVFQGPQVRDAFPDDIKTAKDKQFKDLIKTWFLENKCACSILQQMIQLMLSFWLLMFV